MPIIIAVAVVGLAAATAIGCLSRTEPTATELAEGSGREFPTIVGRRDTNSVLPTRLLVQRALRLRKADCGPLHQASEDRTVPGDASKPLLTIAHRRAASGAGTRTGLRRQLIDLL